MKNSDTGPDIVLAGAARSGTSFLSATLGRHSQVDAGNVKEPNYFSSRWGSGDKWYDEQFAPRKKGLHRLDSSVSYTYPQHPDALSRVSQAAPHAKVIYSVRHPLIRLVSMYHLFHYYAAPEMFANLGEAVDKSQMCVGSGDYSLWLRRIREHFPIDQVLVVPFPMMTTRVDETLEVVLPWLGLAKEAELIQHEVGTYRNEVRQFRWSAVSRMQRRMHASGVYPKIRSRLGPDRLRAIRRLVTHSASIPSVAEELSTLSTAQRARVDEISGPAIAAIDEWLGNQDGRLGLEWSSVWAEHLSQGIA